jgi:hypothetical protein
MDWVRVAAQMEGRREQGDQAESWNRANPRRKKILFKFLLNSGFGRTLENCTGRF